MVKCKALMGSVVKGLICHYTETCSINWGWTDQGMRQVVGFGDRSTGRDTFGGEFGARHCNQWGLYGLCVRECREAALISNYFGQTC